jgi:hypothetical protein
LEGNAGKLEKLCCRASSEKKIRKAEAQFIKIFTRTAE